MTFERHPPIPGSRQNRISFDSTPSESLGRAFGWDPDSVRLDETGRTESEIYFDVYAAQGSKGHSVGDESFRGVLTAITREEIWRRMS